MLLLTSEAIQQDVPGPRQWAIRSFALVKYVTQGVTPNTTMLGMNLKINGTATSLNYPPGALRSWANVAAANCMVARATVLHTDMDGK